MNIYLSIKLFDNEISCNTINWHLESYRIAIKEEIHFYDVIIQFMGYMFEGDSLQRIILSRTNTTNYFVWK